MPVTVSTCYLGNPEAEKKLRAAIERFFKKYPDHWTVQIIGAGDNDVWKLTVSASDGQRKWVHNLHGHDGAHNAEAIFKILENSFVELPLNQ